MHSLLHHFEIVLGLNNINDNWYAFWSGIGGDLGELTIAATIVHHLRSSRKQRDTHHDQLKRHIDYKFHKLTEAESDNE